MAKIKRVLFNQNFYEVGEVKYAAGQHYPVNEETARCVVAGTADNVEVDMKIDAIEAKTNTDENAKKLAEMRADLDIAKKAVADAQAAVKDNTDSANASALAKILADAEDNLVKLQDHIAAMTA